MNKTEQDVIAYYNTGESKHGYNLFLGGTKHFGYYKKGDHAWQANRALRQMEELLASKLKLPEGSKVLDAGCGVGDVASYLAANHKLHITGIDILDFNIQEAKRRVKARGLEELVDLKLMSYENLKFPKNSFDAIYTMETLVHASNPEKVLKDFYRILKPAGKLVMFEYSHDKDSLMSKRARKVFLFINTYAAMPSFQLFTHGTLLNLIKQGNFKNVKVDNIADNIKPMMRLFSLVAFVPYIFVSLLGKRKKYINMMSAVEFQRYVKHIKYNVYSAVKP